MVSGRCPGYSVLRRRTIYVQDVLHGASCRVLNRMRRRDGPHEDRSSGSESSLVSTEGVRKGGKDISTVTPLLETATVPGLTVLFIRRSDLVRTVPSRTALAGTPSDEGIYSSPGRNTMPWTRKAVTSGITLFSRAYLSFMTSPSSSNEYDRTQLLHEAAPE